MPYVGRPASECLPACLTCGGLHVSSGVNLYAKDLGKQINMSTMVPPACAADDVARAMALQLKHQAPLLPSAEAVRGL